MQLVVVEGGKMGRRGRNMVRKTLKVRDIYENRFLSINFAFLNIFSSFIST